MRYQKRELWPRLREDPIASQALPLVFTERTTADSGDEHVEYSKDSVCQVCLLRRVLRHYERLFFADRAIQHEKYDKCEGVRPCISATQHVGKALMVRLAVELRKKRGGS